jgi:hypothetical protein
MWDRAWLETEYTEKHRSAGDIAAVDAIIAWLKSDEYDTGVLEIPLKDAKWRILSLRTSTYFSEKLGPWTGLYLLAVGPDGQSVRVEAKKRGSQ